MPIIESAITPPPDLPVVNIEVDRFQLQKCRFRCRARDGTDFAFALEYPLEHGSCVFQTASLRYDLKQLPEKVLRIPLPASPAEAAQLAWQIGNLHQPVEVRECFLLVTDDPALRRILKKIGTRFETAREIFCPPPHSAFPPHQHVPGIEYDHSHFFGISHGTG